MNAKIKFLVLAAISAAMVVACEKMQVTDVEEPQKPSTETSYDPAKYLTGFSVAQEAVTKADLDFDSGVITWTEGDVVKIVRSDGMSANYTYDANESKFVPEGCEPIEKNGSEMHAFFPADKFTAATGGTVTFTMPEAFETTTGVSNPMAGTVPVDATEETVITLRNLGSIYKVNLKTAKESGETVTKLELGNTAVYLTGSAPVSFGTDGIPALSGELNGGKAVSITFAEPVRLSSEPKSVYFFLPASGTLTGMYVKAVFGKTVGGVTYEPYEQKTRNSEMTLGRNKLWYMNFSVKGFFSGGDGLTSDTAYEIASADDFKAIKTKMESEDATDGYVSETGTFFGSEGVFYKQTDNIDFNSTDITANMIGSSANPFKGTYDGNGNELQNVSINASADNAGVFGYVDGGTVKSIKVAGSVSSNGKNVGGIAGNLRSGTLMNCINTSSVSGSEKVGGIVGYIHNGIVSSCLNNASITGTETGGEVGGIAGSVRGGTMVDCFSKQGKTIKGHKRVGGLAGYLSNQGGGASLIINCSSRSNVLSTASEATDNYGAAGGLVGYMYASDGDGKTVVLANCVALASSICNTGSANAYLGAIVGFMNGQTESNLLVRNCYSQHNSITINRSSVYYSESVDGSTINATKQAYMGAIYGRRAKGYVKDCYCVGDNANGYGITNTSAKVYVGIGTSSGSGSVANCRAVSNSVKNGE